MGGTIRCKHGYILRDVGIIGQSGYLNQVVILQYAGKVRSDLDLEHKNGQCKTLIPRSVYDKIQAGGNFTHVFLKDKAEYDQYLKDHAERFQYMGLSGSPMSNGMYHLVF
jgi:hypothetical protein